MTAIKPTLPAPALPAERSDVRVAANRCPFCHEDVQLETSEWVACRSCQARHHRDCWSEAGACGSCGTDVFLAEPQLTPQPPSGRPTSVSVIGWAWLILGSFLILSGTGALLAGSAIAISPREEVPPMLSLFLLVAALQVAGGALGAVSGFQLLRLRSWARAVLEALTWPLLLGFLLFAPLVLFGILAGSPGVGGPELVGTVMVCAANAAIFGVPLGLMLKSLRSDELRAALRR